MRTGLSALAGSALLYTARTSRATSDPGYRVIIGSHTGAAMPPQDRDWLIEYVFTVPPLPSGTWDYRNQTFYLWGDIDFDAYGSGGAYGISSYRFNQIVPQLMAGNCLCSNDAAYTPGWRAFSSWVIQAQYYWMNGSSNYAQCGPLVNVQPGDILTTRISYTAATGKVQASIASARGTSSITINRPFPNEPALFSSWSSFFAAAQRKSGTAQVLANPVVNVETHYVDPATIRSVLPLAVSRIALPEVPMLVSQFDVTGNPDFGLRSGMASLSFAGFAPNRQYRLQTQYTGTGLSLDVDPATLQLRMASSGDYSGQSWTLTPTGGGFYRLGNQYAGSDRSLDVYKDTRQPCLAPTANVTGQQWKLTPLGGGYLRLTNQYTGSGVSLDQYADTKQPCLASTGDESGQHWYLTPI
jgi:hypothetical protein